MSKRKNKTLNILASVLAILLVGGAVTALVHNMSSNDDIKSSSNITTSDKGTSNSITSDSKSSNIDNSTSSSNVTSSEESSSSVNSEEIKSKSLSILDGSTDSLLNNSYIDETNKFSYEIKGISSLSSVSSSYQYCETTGKTYTKAISTGGACSNSKYIKLVISSDLLLDISIVGSATSSQYIFISDKIESSYNRLNNYELQVTSNTWSVGNSIDKLGVGTYYINFTGNVKIAEIKVNFNS